MKNNFKVVVIALVLMLCISIGYSMLSETLSINGLATVKSNTFDVKFMSVSNETIHTTGEGKIVSAAAIDSTERTINFSVELDKPGDYYTFKAKRKNVGTINATLSTGDPDGVVITGLKNTSGELLYDKIKLTVLDDDVSNSTVTGNIFNNLMADPNLDAGEEDTVTVKLEYDSDLTNEDLLSNPLNLNISITMNYIQNS